MMQINDIITDEIGSVYADTAIWCNQNNAMLEEIEPIEKEVEEEYTETDDEGHEAHKTRTVIKQYRQFKVVAVPEQTEEELNAIRITELQNRLDETDWYAVRYAETGVEIPDEIRTERQSAREEISRLREEALASGD